MSMPTMTIPQGIRLSGRRMTVVTAALLFALLGYSIPSNMLVPLVSVLAGFGLFGALVATSTFAQLPHVPGLDGLGAGPVVGALVIVPVEWLMILIADPGDRGRRVDRGARPHIEGPVPAGVSGVPDAATGAEAG
jgi:hypothetical protein